MSLSGSFFTETNHEAILTYNNDGYTIQLKDLFNDGRTAEITGNNSRPFDYEEALYPYDDENARNPIIEDQGLILNVETLILEAFFNDQKVSTEASLVTGYGPMGYKFNSSIIIETPFDFLHHAKLNTAYEEEYKNGRIRQHAEGSAEYNEFEVRFYHHFAYLSINYFEEPVVDHNTFSSVLINFICVFFFIFNHRPMFNLKLKMDPISQLRLRCPHHSKV